LIVFPLLQQDYQWKCFNLTMKKTQAVRNILKQHNITSWFQPIINVETRELLGWEAFTRGPSVGPIHDAPSLFDSAAQAGVLKPFDVMCMHNAALCFEQLQLQGKLFVKLSNEMLVASSRLKKQVGAMIADSSLPTSKIVLEIDERNACNNLEELIQAVHFFHEQGFEIAIAQLGDIEDLNDTTALQNLWAKLKPNYVKIGRQFITNLLGSASKQAFVREIVALVRSVNSSVIAEGVETQRELEKLQDLGVQNIQGYLIQKPELAPVAPNLEKILPSLESINSNANLACDLVVSKNKVESNFLVEDVINIFEEKVFLNSLAVVEDDKIIGMVYRTSFLAKLSSRQRRDVLASKSIKTEMEKDFLQVDSHVRMEQVSRLVTARARLYTEHDFAITSQNKFIGVGTAIDLLRKITQLRTDQDQQSNLLTMLPGNVPIGDCVSELLERDAKFTIALLDLNNFKPFNNHYDHTKGDELLVIFADLIRKHINSDTDFAGHIGGDDFVVILQQDNWQAVLASLFTEFDHRVLNFYTEEDQAQGGIQSTNRFGEDSFFDFVNISGGAISLTEEFFESFQSLLTLLIKLKQRTKRDKTLRLAHQQNNTISLLSFEEGKFDEIINEKAST